ncbi:FeoA family protein [Dysosmobacter sp.]|uniref:FeoA family protein n=1 Tax=Dysosmobacter sp. TaxID=2591382 RepID=UPI002A89D4CF|nr:FeoA family protein [Dysosmobacter sp.]MDY3985033.1 FeoA family protein [Dysosmobacter sp.]
MTLDTLPLGQEAVITAVGGKGALRLRLLDMGLIPKTAVLVEKVAPLGDPIELRVRGYALSLRKEDARNIAVEVKNV